VCLWSLERWGGLDRQLHAKYCTGNTGCCSPVQLTRQVYRFVDVILITINYMHPKRTNSRDSWESRTLVARPRVCHAIDTSESTQHAAQSTQLQAQTSC
jgi:hypothetical protein